MARMRLTVSDGSASGPPPLGSDSALLAIAARTRWPAFRRLSVTGANSWAITCKIHCINQATERHTPSKYELVS